MSELVDPLKMRSYGVKKHIEERVDKINALQQQSMRYYPVDGKGNLDEWGAVIKRQVEAIERERQELALQNQQKTIDYAKELEKEMQSNQEKRRIQELQKIDDKLRMDKEQQMRDQIEQEMKEKDRLNRLAQSTLLKNDIDNRNKRVMDLKRLQQYQDQKDLERNMEMLALDNLAQKDRKAMMRNNQAQDIEESKKLRRMKENYQKQLDDQDNLKSNSEGYFVQHDKRVQVMQDKLKQAEEFQKKAIDNYNQLIQSNNLNAQQKEKLYLQMSQEQRDLEMRSKSQESPPYSMNEKIQMIEELNKEKKKEMQKVYREMLNQQMQIKENMKMHGNMTSEEKKLNKEDLYAWKVYDNNQYSLIPGVSSNKRFMDRSRIQQKINVNRSGAQSNNYQSRFAYDPDFEAKQQRLKQYGLTRDVRDIYKLASDNQNIVDTQQQYQQQQNVPKNIDTQIDSQINPNYSNQNEYFAKQLPSEYDIQGRGVGENQTSFRAQSSTNEGANYQRQSNLEQSKINQQQIGFDQANQQRSTRIMKDSPFQNNQYSNSPQYQNQGVSVINNNGAYTQSHSSSRNQSNNNVNFKNFSISPQQIQNLKLNPITNSFDGFQGMVPTNYSKYLNSSYSNDYGGGGQVMRVNRSTILYDTGSKILK